MPWQDSRTSLHQRLTGTAGPASATPRPSIEELRAQMASRRPQQAGTQRVAFERPDGPVVEATWRQKVPVMVACLALVTSGLFAVAAFGPSANDAAGDEGIELLGQRIQAPRVPQTDNADLHCFGSAVLFFNPGLTVEPTPQTITGYMNAGNELSPTTPCSSATGIPYKGGTAEIKGSGTLACTAARGTLGNAEGTAEIIWDNGDESSATWSAISYGALPVVEVKITEGELKGSTVYQEGVPTSITGNCVLNPVTSLGASGVATIINEEEIEKEVAGTVDGVTASLGG